MGADSPAKSSARSTHLNVPSRAKSAPNRPLGGSWASRQPVHRVGTTRSRHQAAATQFLGSDARIGFPDWGGATTRRTTLGGGVSLRATDREGWPRRRREGLPYVAGTTSRRAGRKRTGPAAARSALTRSERQDACRKAESRPRGVRNLSGRETCGNECGDKLLSCCRNATQLAAQRCKSATRVKGARDARNGR
jgi:hypothetical protein